MDPSPPNPSRNAIQRRDESDLTRNSAEARPSVLGAPASAGPAGDPGPSRGDPLPRVRHSERARSATVRTGSRCTLEERIAVVLRMLRGEELDELARETGEPLGRLRDWRSRFLRAGRDSLACRTNPQWRALDEERRRLAAELESSRRENAILRRRLGSGAAASRHPYSTSTYCEAVRPLDAEAIAVPPWQSFVLARRDRRGARSAMGLPPFASLPPDCDLQAGLEQLRLEGVTRVSLVTDTSWSPSESAWKACFALCRPFKVNYVVDYIRPYGRFERTHRKRIAAARRRCDVSTLCALGRIDEVAEMCDAVARKRDIQSWPGDSKGHLQALLELEGMTAIAALEREEVVHVSLWLRHGDLAYYHLGASNPRGYEISAAHAAFAHAVELFEECRSLNLGPGTGLLDGSDNGLAAFKKGFANARVQSLLCVATLDCRGPTVS